MIVYSEKKILKYMMPTQAETHSPVSPSWNTTMTSLPDICNWMCDILPDIIIIVAQRQTVSAKRFLKSENSIWTSPSLYAIRSMWDIQPTIIVIMGSVLRK